LDAQIYSATSSGLLVDQINENSGIRKTTLMWRVTALFVIRKEKQITLEVNTLTRRRDLCSYGWRFVNSTRYRSK